MPIRDNSSKKMTELASGQKAGKYILESGITGYKRILCHCEGFSLPTIKIAKISIPKGATVIRGESYEIDTIGDRPIKTRTVSKGVRTNCFKMVEVETILGETVKKYTSWFDSKQEYKLGIYYKVENINEDLCRVHTAGLHFYLTKRDAEIGW